VRVTVAFGNVRQMTDHLIAADRDDAIKQGHIDVSSDTRDGAVMECGQNSNAGIIPVITSAIAIPTFFCGPPPAASSRSPVMLLLYE
jgi:hypothetical protein